MSHIGLVDHLTASLTAVIVTLVIFATGLPENAMKVGLCVCLELKYFAVSMLVEV